MTKQSATRKGVLERGKTDWTAVEKLYRAGVLTLRAIADAHHVTEGAVRKRAKVGGWVRAELREAVMERAAGALGTQVGTQGTQPHARAPEEVRSEAIEEGAAMVVQVVRSHRANIRAGRELVDLMLAQLGTVALNRDHFEDIAVEETAGDKSTKRRSLLMDAVGLPRHASTLRDLSVALKNVIGLERQAFGMGDAPPEAPDAAEAEVANAATPGLRELAAKWEAVLGRAPTTH